MRINPHFGKLPKLRFRRESPNSPWKFVTRVFESSQGHARSPQAEDHHLALESQTFKQEDQAEEETCKIPLEIRSFVQEDPGELETPKILEKVKRESPAVPDQVDRASPTTPLDLQLSIQEDPVKRKALRVSDMIERDPATVSEEVHRASFQVPKRIKRAPSTNPKKIERRPTPVPDQVERPRKQRSLGPQIDSCVIPKHLRDTVKRDYWDKNFGRDSVKQGYLDEDVTDEKLTGHYLLSARQDPKLEVVRYSRVSRNGRIEKPELRKKPLYHRGEFPEELDSPTLSWAIATAENK
ncbi:hypothetical protein EDD37DRAFT_66714 [Exophiala viscosa]|uniref:uncharacterized protein n=1 Tax=Exophiala viscosa TaxID=2486360 RepID=UPI0021975868|nr:hypothetical protein EDD37DRAFT_66714 [Exophiala viscosa]